MHLNDLKAEFSHAYVRAVVHAAGFFVQESGRMADADGVDLTVLSRGAGGVRSSRRFDVQLKATAKPILEDPFPFDLEAHNYNQLCDTNYQVDRVLVVVVLPQDQGSWVTASQTELVMRHCGYWLSLRGQAPTQNQTSVRVRLPRSACFHVAQVQAMIDRIRQGGHP
jgi:hypothetical protein